MQTGSVFISRKSDEEGCQLIDWRQMKNNQRCKTKQRRSWTFAPTVIHLCLSKSWQHELCSTMAQWMNSGSMSYIPQWLNEMKSVTACVTYVFNSACKWHRSSAWPKKEARKRKKRKKKKSRIKQQQTLKQKTVMLYKKEIKKNWGWD